MSSHEENLRDLTDRLRDKESEVVDLTQKIADREQQDEAIRQEENDRRKRKRAAVQREAEDNFLVAKTKKAMLTTLLIHAITNKTNCYTSLLDKYFETEEAMDDLLSYLKSPACGFEFGIPHMSSIYAELKKVIDFRSKKSAVS